MYFFDAVFAEVHDLECGEVREGASRQRRYAVAVEVEFAQIPQSSERVHIDPLNAVAPQQQLAQILASLQPTVAEWLACSTQAQKGLGLNRRRDAVG